MKQGQRMSNNLIKFAFHSNKEDHIMSAKKAFEEACDEYYLGESYAHVFFDTCDYLRNLMGAEEAEKYMEAFIAKYLNETRERITNAEN